MWWFKKLKLGEDNPVIDDVALTNQNDRMEEEECTRLDEVKIEEEYSLIDEDDLANPERDIDEPSEDENIGLLDRYFTNEENAKCYNCYKRGHSKQHCPYNLKICNYCLGNHERKNCENTLSCFNCGGTDHVRNECKVKDKDRCFRCFKAFHNQDDCFYIVMARDVVDYYFDKTVICLSCGKYGHSNCAASNYSKYYSKNDNLYGERYRSKEFSTKHYAEKLNIGGLSNLFESALSFEVSKKRSKHSDSWNGRSNRNKKVKAQDKNQEGNDFNGGYDDYYEADYEYECYTYSKRYPPKSDNSYKDNSYNYDEFYYKEGYCESRRDNKRYNNKACPGNDSYYTSMNHGKKQRDYRAEPKNPVNSGQHAENYNEKKTNTIPNDKGSIKDKRNNRANKKKKGRINGYQMKQN